MLFKVQLCENYSTLKEISPLIALILLVGQQEWHMPCNQLGVGLLRVMILLQISPPSPSSLPLAEKNQNGDIPVLAKVHLAK